MAAIVIAEQKMVGRSGGQILILFPHPAAAQGQKHNAAACQHGCQAEFSGWQNGQLERQKKELETTGVSGSAVVPNPEVDPQWKARREQAQESCTKSFLGVINS